MKSIKIRIRHTAREIKGGRVIMINVVRAEQIHSKIFFFFFMSFLSSDERYLNNNFNNITQNKINKLENESF